MRSLRDRESMQRGSPDYPLDYYLIDRNHPRYEMPYHWHAETELLHVISGQFSMTIDEETFLLAAGDAVYIAPGSPAWAASRRTASMNALFLTCIS